MEERLLIDLCMFRQVYERQEITEVFWILGDQNPAESFTNQLQLLHWKRFLKE